LTISSNETLLWNDTIVCDGVEDVIQSVTELCISQDSNKKPAAEVLPNYVPEQAEIVNEATEAMPNSVTEQGEIINEVSTTNIDVCGVTAGNNVVTTNIVINEDRVFLERYKECLDRYEAICAVQQALESDLIDSFEDEEVYNKIGANGKPQTLEELKPPYIYVTLLLHQNSCVNF